MASVKAQRNLKVPVIGWRRGKVRGASGREQTGKFFWAGGVRRNGRSYDHCPVCHKKSVGSAVELRQKARQGRRRGGQELPWKEDAGEMRERKNK